MSEQKITPEMIKAAGEMLRKEHSERLRLEKLAQETMQEKRAHKVAFREVELGLHEPYKTHEEFVQKVASLMQEDLDVVEKALERGYVGTRKIGELAGSSPANGKNPFERFVLTGELDNE